MTFLIKNKNKLAFFTTQLGSVTYNKKPVPLSGRDKCKIIAAFIFGTLCAGVGALLGFAVSRTLRNRKIEVLKRQEKEVIAWNKKQSAQQNKQMLENAPTIISSEADKYKLQRVAAIEERVAIVGEAIPGKREYHIGVGKQDKSELVPPTVKRALMARSTLYL